MKEHREKHDECWLKIKTSPSKCVERVDENVGKLHDDVAYKDVQNCFVFVFEHSRRILERLLSSHLVGTRRHSRTFWEHCGVYSTHLRKINNFAKSKSSRNVSEHSGRREHSENLTNNIKEQSFVSLSFEIIPSTSPSSIVNDDNVVRWKSWLLCNFYVFRPVSS